jgi:hypothetical protein
VWHGVGWASWVGGRGRCGGSRVPGSSDPARYTDRERRPTFLADSCGNRAVSGEAAARWLECSALDGGVHSNAPCCCCCSSSFLLPVDRVDLPILKGSWATDQPHQARARSPHQAAHKQAPERRARRPQCSPAAASSHHFGMATTTAFQASGRLTRPATRQAPKLPSRSKRTIRCQAKVDVACSRTRIASWPLARCPLGRSRPAAPQTST